MAGNAPEGPAAPDGPQDDLDDWLAKARRALAGLGDDPVGREAARIDVRGTFNAMALRGLAGANDAEQRTAAATEETARHTRRLAQAARNGELTFG